MHARDTMKPRTVMLKKINTAEKAIATLALTDTNSIKDVAGNLHNQHDQLSCEQVAALIYCAALHNENELLNDLVIRYEEIYPEALNDAVATLAHNNKQLPTLQLIEKFFSDINIAAYSAAFNGCHELLQRLLSSKRTTQTPIDMDSVARGYVDGGNGTAAEKMVQSGYVSAQVVVEAYHKDGYVTRALALEDAAKTVHAMSELHYSDERHKAANDVLVNVSRKYQFEQEKRLQPNEHMKLVDFSQTYRNITVSSIGVFSSTDVLKHDLQKAGEEHSKRFGFK